MCVFQVLSVFDSKQSMRLNILLFIHLTKRWEQKLYFCLAKDGSLHCSIAGYCFKTSRKKATHVKMSVTDSHTDRRTDMRPCRALAERRGLTFRLWTLTEDDSRWVPSLPLSEPVINEERDRPLCLFRPLVSDIVLLKSSAEVSAIKT